MASNKPGMLEEDRQIINRNFSKLVANTSDISLDRIVGILVEFGILSEKCAEKYLMSGEPPKTRKMQFYVDIQQRGPLAFERLKHAVSMCGYFDLLHILQPVDLHQHPSASGARPSQLPDYLNEMISEKIYETMENYPDALINFGEGPLEVRVKEAERRLDLKLSSRPRYRCGSSPKGLALIVNIREYEDKNHSHRQGAEHDDKNLEQLFSQLGYQTEVHVDLNKNDFMDVIKKFVTNPKHFEVHTCMVAIMSHGQMLQPELEDNVTSVFIATDGKTIPYTWVIDQFSSEHCRGLVNKPKVFFFQACRGETKHQVVNVSNMNYLNDTTEADGMGCMPTPVRRLSDILIAHATPRGFVALRDVNKGSWFIQKIVQVFMAKAWNTHVRAMLEEVDDALAKNVTGNSLTQTMCLEQIGFNHKLFLSPGLYD